MSTCLQMDPIQKAVINHTFGLAHPKKKPIISCNICHLRFNSTVSRVFLVFPLIPTKSTPQSVFIWTDVKVILISRPNKRIHQKAKVLINFSNDLQKFCIRSQWELFHLQWMQFVLHRTDCKVHFCGPFGHSKLHQRNAQ